MCRNIKPLFNFDPPVTDEEVRAASLQFVRKISGFTKPSKTNEAAFDRAIDEVSAAARRLMDSLVTTAPARDREIEAAKAKARAAERYGTSRRGQTARCVHGPGRGGAALRLGERGPHVLRAVQIRQVQLPLAPVPGRDLRVPLARRRSTVTSAQRARNVRKSSPATSESRRRPRAGVAARR